MSRPQRSSDLVEIQSEKAVMYGFGGLVALALSILLIVYRGESGMFVPLAVILGLGGLAGLGYAGYCIALARQVPSVDVVCPICQAVNKLTEAPAGDFSCIECHRLVPIKNGQALPVQQVRCGYCNELNYYSEKTEVLLCESCNHEIPLTVEEGRPQRSIPQGFAVRDDAALYELTLVAHGAHKTEELVAALQHMLALNRNQVKQLLNEMPVVLLSGIPKRKAEMLAAQLAIHEGLTEVRQLPGA